MKNSWLFIEPHTYLEVHNDNVLLYNTFTGKTIEYLNNSKIANLFKSEYTFISCSDRKEPEIGRLIRKLQKLNLGGILDSSMFGDLPIRLACFRNEDLDHLTEKIRYSFPLKELTLYINENCELNCSCCDKAYRQFLYCSKLKDGCQEVRLLEICDLLVSLQSAAPSKLNILGGNIFAHSQINELIGYLNNTSSLKTYFIDYRNFNSLSEMPLSIIERKNSRVMILANMPVDSSNLAEIIHLLNKYSLEFYINLLVRNSSDIEIFEEIPIKGLIDNYYLTPFYDGTNLSFFEDFVFWGKEEVFKDRVSIQDINIKKKLNLFDFNKLVILPNGDIHSNINSPKLGSIYHDRLGDIASAELTEGSNLLRIRSNVTPCNACIYNSLCPPLGNYEYTIGRNNLCHFQLYL